MNPVPLSNHGGTVYAYACGRCKSVHAPPTREGKDRTSPDEVDVEYSRKRAGECCCCRGCGVPLVPLWANNGRCSDCQREYDKELGETHRRFREQEEKRKRLREESLSLAKDRSRAESLERLMMDVSEDYYCAGWLVDLEYLLWDLVVGSKTKPVVMIREPVVKEMKELSETSGGWWTWVGKAGTKFVPMEEWLDLYLEKFRTDKAEPLEEDQDNGQNPAPEVS